MKTYEEALALVLSNAGETKSEKVSIQQSINRVLREPVRTKHPLPPFTNSQMDGYAVHAADLLLATPEHPISLCVVGNLSAGDSAVVQHSPGHATRIMTGAPMPEGADAVVAQEDVEICETCAVFRAAVDVGDYVRFAGEDVAAGSVVLDRGERLRPGGLGTAVASGASRLVVAKRPRASIITTGNELVAPGAPLQPGQIYNSNLYSLQAQVEEAGGEVVRTLTVRDDFDSLKTAFEQCHQSDLIITSGGVSVGDKDFLRPVIEEIGRIIFWQVAIRPGKPVALSRVGASLVLSLPGNPSSSYVTFELFARQLLLKMQGARLIGRRIVPATLTDDIAHTPGRRSFVRVTLTLSGSNILATPTGPQGSGMVTPTAFADGLLIISEHQAGARSGARGRVILLD